MEMERRFGVRGREEAEVKAKRIEVRILMQRIVAVIRGTAHKAR